MKVVAFNGSPRKDGNTYPGREHGLAAQKAGLITS